MKPTMFSTPNKKQFKVYVLVSNDTGEIRKCSFSSNHYLTKNSAEYMRQIFGVDYYTCVEMLYSPSNSTYEGL